MHLILQHPIKPQKITQLYLTLTKLKEYGRTNPRETNENRAQEKKEHTNKIKILFHQLQIIMPLDC